MELHTWLAYAAACFILTVTPGPSILLGITHSISYGPRKTLFTALGDISANFVQMMLVMAGIGALIASSNTLFLILKWLGVANLIFLGLKMFFSKNSLAMNALTPSLTTPNNFALYCQGFMVAFSNPKAIIFYTSFLPQFIDPHRAFFDQALILCPTMAILDFFWVMTYGISAKRVLHKLTASAQLINRIGGSVLLGMAVMLAMVEKKAN
jgi:hypothetical protein